MSGRALNLILALPSNVTSWERQVILDPELLLTCAKVPLLSLSLVIAVLAKITNKMQLRNSCGRKNIILVCLCFDIVSFIRLLR